ncbi:GNAT family N-acetyltransferase [Streptomyces sp. NBC_00091]|uniref:GNAT family N-acetyltransferase n=1 Tax=Streptomyces sp. NBC_00091 TaxID=2975648 RepID=UPI002252E16A|nr:GNAT family N-acetyltransferase [Streptomyces sp. NBC_00091]MCX5376826.1 GNAT family N-acetyltransferase [Streptomyces sp. NBC_00091]
MLDWSLRALSAKPDGSVVLEAPATSAGPALVLRPWCLEDVDALVEAYRDPVLARWAVSVPVPDSEAAGVRWVQDQQRRWAAGERFAFAVLEAGPDPASGHPASRRLVGGVVLKEVVPGKPSAEVGYWTVAHARGRGVAPRALEALTTWAFETFRADGLEGLELLHQVDNPASCRVAGKSGYPFDRTLPAAPPAYPLDGHLHLRRADAP